VPDGGLGRSGETRRRRRGVTLTMSKAAVAQQKLDIRPTGLTLAAVDRARKLDDEADERRAHAVVAAAQ
jgi:hypothetical protein